MSVFWLWAAQAEFSPHLASSKTIWRSSCGQVLYLYTITTNLCSGGLDGVGGTLVLAASEALLETRWLTTLLVSEEGVILLGGSTTGPPLTRLGGSTVVMPPFRIFSSSQLKPGSSCAKRRPFSCIWAEIFCVTFTAVEASPEKKAT